MTTIKFFREKNALSINNAITRTPSKNELIFEHINKLKDKAMHIKTICNKALRDQYLKNKKMYEKSLKMSQKMIKDLLFERVCIDILELVLNLSTLTHTKITPTTNTSHTEIEIADNILTAISQFDTENGYFEPITTIYQQLVSLCNINNFSVQDLTDKMNLIIEAEGSFLTGLYVIFND